ncbi:hypothetical protein MOUN0_H00320 [Monosporozyma unispora]
MSLLSEFEEGVEKILYREWLLFLYLHRTIRFIVYVPKWSFIVENTEVPLSGNCLARFVKARVPSFCQIR